MTVEVAKCPGSSHTRSPAHVVAGASSGIGAATAANSPRRGYPVALGARRVEKLEELAAQIRADGGEAVAYPLDLTDDESVNAFAAQSIDRLGEIEVVVSNAGDMSPATVEVSTERFDRRSRST